jgi:hypothetical protein
MMDYKNEAEELGQFHAGCIWWKVSGGTRGSTPLERSSIPDAESFFRETIEMARTLWAESDLLMSVQYIERLTSYLSGHEEIIRVECIDLDPLINIYRESGVDVHIWNCFADGNFEFMDSLIAHVHCLLKFPEFRELLSEKSVLDQLFLRFIDYSGDQLLQFSLILIEMIRMHPQFCLDFSCSQDHISKIMAKLKDPVLFGGVFQFCYCLMRVWCNPLSAEMVLDVIDFPTDPEHLHFFYRTCTTMVKTGGREAVELLDRFKVHSVLLNRCENGNRQLMKDQIKYLTSILHDGCSDSKDRLYFIMNPNFGLDYSTLASTADIELYPYLFELFRVISCDFGGELFERYVTVDRLDEMLIATLERGSFGVKRTTFDFMADLIDKCPSFSHKVIARDRFFKMSRDVLESENCELQCSYLTFIEKVMTSVSDDRKLKLELIIRLEMSCASCIIRRFSNRRNDFGYLARDVTLQLERMCMEARE